MQRRWIAPVALVVGSVLFALLIGELALRVLDVSYYWSVSKRPDPLLGWRPVPGAEGWQRIEGEARVRINDAGFRDRDHDSTKPPGTLRIAVLGDSFTEAVQLPVEQTWWRVLEQRLVECPAFEGRRLEVMNFGVSGYSSAQQLQAWRHVASDYGPDIVILGFFPGNDIRENSPALDRDPMRPYLIERENELVVDLRFRDSDEYRFRTSLPGRIGFWLLSHSRLLQVADEARDRWRLREPARSGAGETRPRGEPGVDSEIYVAPEDPDWATAWELTERILSALHREVEAAGARLWVTSMSTGAQVHPDPRVRARIAELLGVNDLLYPGRRIAALGERRGFEVVDLVPELQLYAGMSGAWLHGFENGPRGIGHWNAVAHHLAGRILAERLCPKIS
jgi:hypothetical protein